jgi:acyl carrier protein
MSSKMSEIAERITKILVENLGVDAARVKPGAKLVDDLGADSLDLVELMVSIEDEFEIEITDDAFENVQTVGEAIELIRRNIKP